MLRTGLTLATFLVLACASCSDDEPSPTPLPSESSSSSSSSSSPVEPTSTVPSELAEYTEEERSAYGEAVPAYDAFIERNDAFYAAGETTVAAKRFYQRNAIDWSTAWGNLGQVVNSGIKVTGTTETKWTEPESIELGEPAVEVVVIHRCLDESGRVVTQNGEPIEQPQFSDPHVYTIRLEKRAGEDHWRSGVAEQGPTC